MGAVWTWIVDLGRSVVSTASELHFKDILDILIVTFIVYQLIKLMRETRTGQLIKGLLLLFVAFLLSYWFDLVMMNQIFRYVFQYGLILLVIVFQPEIRSALEQIGRSNVGRSLSGAFGARESLAEHVVTKRAIDCVVEASLRLQQLKMGALIVFERRTNLSDIVMTGTVVDAAPSSELLVNIFFNKAPLHDGAVIIRNAKIAAAGCILPLTKRDPLNTSLGTRHRAAIGGSEDTDAVIVVVSEETGQISLAVGGELMRDYNRITLKEDLEKHLIGATGTTVEPLGKRVLNRLGFRKNEGRSDNEQ